LSESINKRAILDTDWKTGAWWTGRTRKSALGHTRG